MDFSDVKNRAILLFAQTEFIWSEQQYDMALELMDQLINEYDLNRPLIDILSNAIEKYENQATEFVEFNRSVADLDNSVALKSSDE
ncbi:hypothetical protein [Pelagibaculum spongiae]|uniref:Transcriptional regulator n=1 Tax=Pelagibaculum spongiae TaxID=2080658 RepID=A0A2V1GW72_9GAMM|nr:hypothetical protein [Pelagibaculum spongiae]PVZ64468.1 hypothetical protein DC094_19320 [Pelagibaculum spongiae]